jgi:hypothetical protein
VEIANAVKQGIELDFIDFYNWLKRTVCLGLLLMTTKRSGNENA